MDGLTDEQTRMIDQFKEVTNENDHEVALATLASLDWDVNRAMEAHFNGEMQRSPSVEVVENEQEVVAVPAEVPRRRVPVAPPRPPARGPRNIPIATSSRIDPPVLRSSTRNNVVELESDDDMDIDDYSYAPVTDYHSDDDNSGPSRDHAVPLVPTDCDDVREAIQNFTTVFEARFKQHSGHGVLPTFHVGALNDAVRAAFDPSSGRVEDRKPLAVYLHHDRSIAANIFPTKVLCSEPISNLLKHQFILWPWDVTQKDNETKLKDWMTHSNMGEARMMYDIRSRNRELFPMLVLFTKEKGTIQVSEFCVGTETVDAVMTKLMSVVDTFNTIRLTDMADAAARRERERIRQEQSQEYEASLAADRARMEAKEREIKEQREAEENRLREEQEELMKRQLIESSLPDEPSATEKDIINVKFRMPDGQQLLRRFRNRETVAVLLNFLTSKGYSPEKNKFFNSDFPKKDVSTMDTSKSFVDLKWPCREQIFVEEI